jgi:hypothetical protein
MDASNYVEGLIAGLYPNPLFVMPCDAYPGETGASGTDLAAARTSVAMAAVSGSNRSNSAQVEITVSPAGNSAHRFWKLYDALTAGNYLGYAVAGTASSQAFVMTDTTNDDIICPNHGLVAGDEVYFLSAQDGKAVPAPLAEGTVYYVIAGGLTTHNLRVSATSGGSAINLSAVGAGFIRKIGVKTYQQNDIIRLEVGGLLVTGF